MKKYIRLNHYLYNDFFKGTVVFSNNPSHPIGEYYQYWDKTYFSAFEGEIILNNKR